MIRDIDFTTWAMIIVVASVFGLIGNQILTEREAREATFPGAVSVNQPPESWSCQLVDAGGIMCVYSSSSEAGVSESD
jgi:hypothetical protein